MVARSNYTEWIAGTQRLIPEQIAVHKCSDDVYLLLVPARSAIWYCVFFAIVWGICGIIFATFWIVVEEFWVRVGVTAACLFVGFILSLEQRLEIRPTQECLVATIRCAFVPISIISRRLPLDHQSLVEATKSRDVEGLRQVQLIIRDGNRKRDILISFVDGWDSYDSACELAKRINLLVSSVRGGIEKAQYDCKGEFSSE